MLARSLVRERAKDSLALFNSVNRGHWGAAVFRFGESLWPERWAGLASDMDGAYRRDDSHLPESGD